MKPTRIAACLLVAGLLAAPAALGQGYVTGDFHNHTTYSDGSTSATTLIQKSVDSFANGGFELDFFVQSGHGGAFNRDGRVDDPEYDGSVSGLGAFWTDDPAVTLLGDPAGTGYGGVEPNMWRWQSIQQYQFGETSQASLTFNKPIWSGVEWQVPGHEHCSVSILGDQFATGGNADALGQFEYLFDYRDNDTSAGAGQGWTGKIANIGNGPGAGYTMHDKSVAAAAWMQANHPNDAYIIFAHIERKGSFNPDKAYSTGFNIEHFRDFNNAGPDVCFGWEGQPGHQEDDSRGGFGSSAFGGGCYGGTGYYCATIGHMWDAMLAEGRNFYLFASSDWHYGLGNGLGAKDFWPGEYQKTHVWLDDTQSYDAQNIIDGMRSGNVFITQGDLITNLEFTASNGRATATMGETLNVQPGDSVTVTVRLQDPSGTNHCQYSDDNPSLLQLGINQPLNQPELHHVDVIGGLITGYVDPADPEYTNPLNPDAGIVSTVDKIDMVDEGNDWYSFTYTYTALAGESRYFRLRGTNMPPSTPYETDADGNPLLDFEAHNIPDEFIAIGETLDEDREAWADLWFYANPVNVVVE